MNRAALANRAVIIPVLFLQLIPLLLFPVESFSPTTQEWWLPALLVILVLIAFVQLLVGRNNALWPWHLMSFAQGFNLISRLMMIWPHATLITNGVTVLNWSYIGLTTIALVLSVFLLWYIELPEVRMNMAKH